MIISPALLVIPALLCAIIALGIALRFRGLISVHELGVVEGTIRDLRRVVVVADHVEPPSDQLREAVANNFERGVKYMFLVSKCNAQSELHGNVELFLGLARMVNAKCHRDLPLSAYVEVNQLGFNWEGYPFIIYEIDSRDSAGGKWLAYEGTDKKNGIADFYAEVPAKEAKKVAQFLFSQGPGPITVPTELEEVADVFPIEAARRVMR